MLDEPALVVRVRRSAEWAASGPTDEHAARSLDFARRGAAGSGDPSPLAVDVVSCPPQHVGLGVGTQLALAVGSAAAAILGQSQSPLEIARRMGRGQRSGIGLHGFLRGGFLVDGGKGPASDLAPLVSRHDFPADWRILLVSPPRERGLSGISERAAFARLAAGVPSEAQTDALCRIALLGLLPALVERDLPAFGAALHDFNHRAGLLFERVQGGVYAAPIVTEIHDWLRREGLVGVGQSSWGPTVFAVGEGDRLTVVEGPLRERFGAETRVVRARNAGYELSGD
jgi:beta-RFAP synthase